MGWISNIIQKFNPAQENIVLEQGSIHYSTTNITTAISAYNKIEVVNRGVNLIVDSASQVRIDIGEALDSYIVRLRKKKLNTLLNFSPNPYISTEEFFRNIYMDLVLDGNAFIYYDGVYLYNLPAINVEIVSSSVTFISHYKYSDKEFLPEEIIHIRDNNAASIFRGASRLQSCMTSINNMSKMNDYQQGFFENHAIPGLVIKSPNILSKKIKDRMLTDWLLNYTAAAKGGRRPMILDGDISIDRLGSSDFRELDFIESLKNHETKILKALGIPPILLDAGNNANLMINMKNFYISTILPLTDKVIAGFERFFGYDLSSIKQDILALRPDLKEEGAYLTALTNAGILTRNEARESIRKQKINDETADSLILPANIAGSAVNPNIGGAPQQSGSNNEQ